jgi:ADP-ribosylation factor GTPase-activating protein 1
MHYYKKKAETNLNNEYIKMIKEINGEELNKVCFECGSINPEFISINNGVFLCKICGQEHIKFPPEISTIKINDLFSLNNKELKMLYFGGNRKLIEFVNNDFPNLKLFPPKMLYVTRAVDYYRKRLQFYIFGGIRPLKPILDSAYQLINEPINNNFFNNLNNKNDIFLSPKNHEKIFNITELTPILEGNQLEDENNCSTVSDKKIEEEHNLEPKKNIFSSESGTKSESTFISVIYSPQKPKNLNGNNSPFFSSNCSILNDMIKNNKNIGKMITFKKHIVHNYPEKEKKNNDNANVNDNKSNNLNDESNIHIDRNISIINIGDSYNNLNFNSERNIININEENF